MISSLSAFLLAATAALKAFPLWLAWRVNGEVEDLAEQILQYESRNSVDDRRRADELRIKLAYRRKLHDTLLTAVAETSKGDRGGDK